jgi:lysophospholipid acyltransferase (LPLAT)-like uncharacterized protein
VTSDLDWRTSRIKRAQVAVIAWIVARCLRLLGRTFRWRVEGLEHQAAVDRSGRPPIMAFWHGRILPATYYFRDRGIVVITSQNFDGEWIARVIERFGYGTARGSSSRGSLRALLQLKRDMAAGRATAFTVDGPRGPARRAQTGVVWLAGATGCPILPFHIEAARCWTLHSWDRTQIPKPFSPVSLAFGAPMDVPPDPTEETLETFRARLEQTLEELERRTRAMVNRGDGHSQPRSAP